MHTSSVSWVAAYKRRRRSGGSSRSEKPTCKLKPPPLPLPGPDSQYWIGTESPVSLCWKVLNRTNPVLAGPCILYNSHISTNSFTLSKDVFLINCPNKFWKKSSFLSLNIFLEGTLNKSGYHCSYCQKAELCGKVSRNTSVKERRQRRLVRLSLDSATLKNRCYLYYLWGMRLILCRC